MDEKYFYLGLFAGALIIAAIVVLLSSTEPETPRVNESIEETENNTAEREIIDRWEDYPRENATHGSRANQKQVIVHRYIPPERPSIRLYNSFNEHNSYNISYSPNIIEKIDRGGNGHTENCYDSCASRYKTGKSRDNKLNNREVLGWGERAYHRSLHERKHVQEPDHEAEYRRKETGQNKETDCDWWDTGYQRLAAAGWHGADEFECWQ